MAVDHEPPRDASNAPRTRARGSQGSETPGTRRPPAPPARPQEGGRGNPGQARRVGEARAEEARPGTGEAGAVTTAIGGTMTMAMKPSRPDWASQGGTLMTAEQHLRRAEVYSRSNLPKAAERALLHARSDADLGGLVA